MGRFISKRYSRIMKSTVIPDYYKHYYVKVIITHHAISRYRRGSRYCTVQG